MIRLIAIALLTLSAAPAVAAPADPLGSPNWPALARSFFGTAPVRFDDRVRVGIPSIAENQRSFPVAIDARGITGVRRILIFADLNPIPLAVDFRPLRAAAYVSTSIKLDQRTPVRGAVELADGSWLVGGAWVDAAGGGCSMPPLSRARGDWAEHLGEIRGGAWATPAGARVRVGFRHPMDTGFVANIPTYHLEEVALLGADGTPAATLTIEASVAEDPEFGLIVAAAPGDALTLSGRDTNGIDYAARLLVSPPTPRSSPAP
jgi:sulfur-oxidizing protein SoxY